MNTLLTLGSLGLVLAAACPRGGEHDPIAPEPNPTSEDLSWRMSEHFDQVAVIKEAAVLGDLAMVAENAEALATRANPGDYPLAWRPAVVDLLAETEGLRTASTVAIAAAGAARLAGTCGACHLATKADPNFGDAMEPSDDDTLNARMERHQWAVDRMWEGIVGPSDDWWKRGAAVFGGPPGCDREFAEEEGDDGERMRRLCSSVDTLGRRAGAAKDRGERVRLYGEFLATCSGCHAGEP